jgi:hypothetical protein
LAIGVRCPDARRRRFLGREGGAEAREEGRAGPGHVQQQRSADDAEDQAQDRAGMLVQGTLGRAVPVSVHAVRSALMTDNGAGGPIVSTGGGAAAA